MKYIGMIFIMFVGALLHFTYEGSNHNKIVAIFSAVNESTWEHIKICMTATILWSVYDFYVYGLSSNYVVAKAFNLLTIILLIPILFYAYSSFTKKSILIVDIICFGIVVVISQLVFYYIISMNDLPYIYSNLSSILLIIEMGAYLFLTFHPFKNFIFEDPISHKYGLDGHTHHHHHKHGH